MPSVCLVATTPHFQAAVLNALLADRAVTRVVCVHDARWPLPSPARPRVQHLTSQLTSYRRLRNLFSGESLREVDTVIHLLPEGAVINTPQLPASVYSEATRALLQLAEEHSHIRRFVLCSSGSVYRTDSREPAFVDENHALELVNLPASLRAYAEADFIVCERLASSRLALIILRCAEILAPGIRGPLHEYLSSRVCLRPIGFDPMLNVLSLADLGRAVDLAATSSAAGIFNIPGADTLPLSELIHAAGRTGIAVPGPALRPLYALRSWTTAHRFDYMSEQARFHYGNVLDGSKARRLLGYVAEHPVELARVTQRALKQQAGT